MLKPSDLPRNTLDAAGPTVRIMRERAHSLPQSWFLRSFALLAIVSSILAVAQDKSAAQARQTANEQVPTFRSGVNLVLVPVVVRNKHGDPVGNLTQENFQIFDRGERQTIASFSVLTQRNNMGQLEPSLNGPAVPSASGTGAADSVSSELETRTPGRANARPQRFIAYVFDDLDVTAADMAAVRSAFSRHLSGLQDADLTAIYTFSGRPEVDFTRDRGKLIAAAAELRSSFASVISDDAKECPNISYYLADLIRNRHDPNALNAAVSHTMACAHVDKFTAESIVFGATQRQLVFGAQESRMALRALRLVIKRLASTPGERLIVFTSPGFYAQTPEAISDTEEALKLAEHAHVTISSLSSRGLYTNQAPASDSTHTAPSWWVYEGQNIQADEGIMQDLAKGTGGVFIHNNNGFLKAFDRVAMPPEFSYVLGFQPTNTKLDGSFHAIRIRLLSEKGLTIEARQGYYALKQEPEKEAARLEVDDALFAHDQKNEIPVVLQTGYAKPNNGDATVKVVAKVDLKPLHFRTANGRNLDSLAVISALFNNDGKYLAGTMKTVNLQLRNETLAQTDPSVTLRFDFRVKPGAYVIRVVIRDAQSGAMTTFSRPEMIP